MSASHVRDPSPQPRAKAILEYFASLPPEMREMDEAWEEALALYGDEDSDAWVAALHDGTHPLFRNRARSIPVSEGRAGW